VLARNIREYSTATTRAAPFTPRWRRPGRLRLAS